MRYESVAYSDVGIKKTTNEDSVLIKSADTDYGQVLLAVVCDGMGGLSKGEVASAVLLDVFSQWFEQEFPVLLYHRRTLKRHLDAEAIQDSLVERVCDCNRKLYHYGREQGKMMGSTVVALLLVEDHYYILNVGDSRAYLVSDKLYVLTRDQSYVQAEVDAGRLTEEEARTHPKRNALLQCVGASSGVSPDFYEGEVPERAVFMLCSDGFRHEITPREFYKALNAGRLRKEKDLMDAAIALTELNKRRMEKDNISTVIIRAC